MSNPIISILVLVLSLGFGFLYVKPEYDTTQQRQVDSMMLDNTLTSSKEIQTLIQQTQKTLAGIDTTALSRFSVFLPETIDPLRLANNLQHIGFTHGIALDKIVVGQPTTTPQLNAEQASDGGVASVAAGVAAAATAQKYATTETAFEFEATDTAFRAFLSDIENNLGLMNVTSLKFAPVTGGDPTKAKSAVPENQYAMTIETYSLK